VHAGAGLKVLEKGTNSCPSGMSSLYPTYRTEYAVQLPEVYLMFTKLR